ncbi:MAG: flavin reductase family protein [Nitratireductor sp.]
MIPSDQRKKFGPTSEPVIENQRQFRNALGQFATGVTIITANTENGPVGMTVNSFASVSLDPALILWSVSKTSGRYEIFKNAKNFATHVLHEDQAELALAFAKNPKVFDDCDWRYGDNNVPIISNTLARFECVQEATHEGGDHTIIIGKVERFSQREGSPLIFSAGKFGSFNT